MFSNPEHRVTDTRATGKAYLAIMQQHTTRRMRKRRSARVVTTETMIVSFSPSPAAWGSVVQDKNKTSQQTITSPFKSQNTALKTQNCFVGANAGIDAENDNTACM